MYRRQLNARADLPQTYAFTTTINVHGVNSMMAVAVRKAVRMASFSCQIEKLILSEDNLIICSTIYYNPLFRQWESM